jgi:hypothetical protein
MSVLLSAYAGTSGRRRFPASRWRPHLLGPARSDASPARRASRRFGGAGLGVSDVAIKAVSGDVLGGSPWIALALCAAIFSFFASARSHQVGEGVAVIAVTSVAANMSSILAGVLVFGDPMGRDPLEVAARIAGFVLVLVGAVLMPAPLRAAHSLGGPTPA